MTVKTQWSKPELIVLRRSKPEESVLVTCKHPSQGHGPNRPNCKVPSNEDCFDLVAS